MVQTRLGIKPEPTSVGERLRAHRLETRLPRLTYAERFGLPFVLVQTIETGRCRYVTREQLEALARVLGLEGEDGLRELVGKGSKLTDHYIRLA